MASIRTRQTSKGKVYDVLYRDSRGRQHSKSFTHKADARAFATKVERDKRTGGLIEADASRVTVAGLWERASRRHEALKPKTRALYETLWNSLIAPRFAEEKITAIRPADVEDWIHEISKGRSASTVKAARGLLSRLLQAAVDQELLARNPCSVVKPPSPEHREARVLAPEEVERLAEEAGPYRALIITAAETGARFGELAALRVEDVNFLKRTIRIDETLVEVRGHLHFGTPKTKASRRVVPVSERVIQEITRSLEGRDVGPKDLVFQAPEGGPLRYSLWRKRYFAPAARRAGLSGLRFHDLRHTHTAWLIEAGVHPKEIQARLGHSTIRVSMDVYGHLFPDSGERVVEALEAYRAGQSIGRQGRHNRPVG